MGKKAEQKTNAMRMLDKAGVSYSSLQYVCDGVHFDGELVAQQVGLPAGQVFKTLVAQDDNRHIVVCCIPVNKKLDLKALAAANHLKKLELVDIKDLLPLTGYIRGGCSPIGMKKQYPTCIDSSVQQWEQVAVSAGIRGQQLLLSPQALVSCTNALLGNFAR